MPLSSAVTACLIGSLSDDRPVMSLSRLVHGTGELCRRPGDGGDDGVEVIDQLLDGLSVVGQ